jgi:hypothetical protein
MRQNSRIAKEIMKGFTSKGTHFFFEMRDTNNVAKDILVLDLSSSAKISLA